MKIFIAGTVNKNIDKKYLPEINELSKRLLADNHQILCVGAKTGAIGEVYNHYIKNNGHVDIIVPIPYADEAEGMQANSKTVVDTLFILQQIALKNTNATIVLPGGNGTLAELYMITDSKQSKYDDDIVIVFNIKGFYNKIKEMNDFLLKSGCLTKKQYNYFTFCNTVDEVIEAINDWDKQIKHEKKKTKKINNYL